MIENLNIKNQEPVFKSNHYNIAFKSFSIDLFLRDCLNGIPERVTDNSVDVIVTSPPYN